MVHAGGDEAFERRYCWGAVTAALALRRWKPDEVYWRGRAGRGSGRWYVLGL